jgi:putative peptidoglycan lipid II flippase
MPFLCARGPSALKKASSLLRTVGAISSATFVSRVLGLARDQVQSYYFGAGLVTDAFIAAFRIPNLLRDLFAEGALSSAFVPTFTAERERHGEEAAWRLANRLITTLALILGALGVGIAVGAPWILRVYVAGFPPQKLQLAVEMTRVLSPFLLFVALAAVAMGVLNTFGRFFLPALAPASFNLAAIAGMVLLVPLLPRLGYDPGMALAIGALCGGALQFLVQVPALQREGFRFRPQLALRDPGLRRIAWLMLPATFGLAATQINILVDTVLASMFDDGPITYLQLAFRLMQLPIGLFGVAIATANLARVSRDAARGDSEAIRRNLAAAIRAAALLTLPATFGLIALREPIVRLLFEHGRFDAADTARTAAAVLCYGLGLFAYAVTKIQVPTFYALGDTRTPVLASATAVTIKIGANFAFIAALRRWGGDAFLGLALATSVAAWINFTWLALALRRRVGPFRGEAVGASCLKMLAISAVMGYAAGAFHGWLERAFGGAGLAGEILRLALAILAGLAVVAGGARVLGIRELSRGDGGVSWTRWRS